MKKNEGNENIEAECNEKLLCIWNSNEKLIR